MLRGGPFAEKRVIELVNLRFVPTFFNVGKGAPGYDAEAAAFIAGVDSRFAGSRVPTPPVWIFAPDGKLLSVLDNYLAKDAFYDELRKVLQQHPQFNKPSKAERAVLAAGARRRANSDDRLRAARLHEQLGSYDEARKLLSKLVKKKTEAGHYALAALVRIERYSQKWKAARAATEKLGKRRFKNVLDDAAMELAHCALEADEFQRGRDLLVAAIRRFPHSERIAEMHYWAGVACFRLGDRPWANFHWGWVLDQLPDDYNYPRCALAAATDAIPWPNPDLAGHRSKSPMVSHALTDAARERAMVDYRRLRKTFYKED